MPVWTTPVIKPLAERRAFPRTSRAPTPPEADRFGLRRLARGFGWTAAAGGVLAVVLWRLGFQDLLSLLPGWPPLMANTGVMLSLCGLSLAQLSGERPGRRSALLARMLAAGAAILAALTAVEYLLRADLGIDQLLAAAQATATMRIPGRPSPHTAAAVLFLSAALVLLDARPLRGRRVAPALALAGGAIALAATLGHLLQTETPYGTASLMPHTEMALLTSVLLLMLSAGVLASRPSEGIMRTVTAEGPGGVAARKLLAASLAFVPCVALMVLGSRAGLYADSSGDVLIVFLGLTSGGAFLIWTARNLNRLDEARRRGEERIRQLVELASDGIFVADLDGRYTEVNEAACRMLGFRRDELLGKTILDLIPADEAERLRQSKDQLLQGGAQVAEWTLRRKDGCMLPVEVSAKILPDGRWQAIVRDISERKRAQKLREEVIAMTSHELRNPLTTALVNVQMLKEDVDRMGERAREMLAMTERAISRMKRLVEDFLDLEKLEAGRIEMRDEQVDLEPLLAEAAAALTAGAAGRIKLTAQPNLIVQGDPDRLLQVAVNLISNALKFSPPPLPVEIEAGRRGSAIRISVRDHGPGIAQAFRGKIFQRFAREPGIEARGSGLGLSISKAIVEELGGQIGFTCPSDGGAEFFFELPAASPAPPERPRQQEP